MPNDDLDPDDDDLSPDEERKFAKFMEKAKAEEKRKADAKKEPKDFGEYTERMKNAFKDALRELADERRNANDDEEPTRGRGSTAFGRFWGTERDAG